jgi:phenylalanyl-tRNA synthetase beta chain
LMEEVARLSGYDNIPLTYPAVSAQDRPVLRIREMRNRIRTLMSGFGFAEAINYSFISANACDRLRLSETDRARRTVRILNPLSEDLAVMRTSLVPGLLETMHRNVSHQEKNLKLFEVGKLYFAADTDSDSDSLPDEVEMLAGLWSGARSDATWHTRESACDFFDLKGVAESLLKALDVSAAFPALPDEACRYTRVGFSAEIRVGAAPVGLIGEVHPEVAQAWGLKQTAYILELNLSGLLPLIPETKQFRPIPKFPSVSRDVTLIVDESIASRTLVSRVEQMNQELVEDVLLFDVFEGKPIAAGKKSVSFRIVYRSASKTLQDEEVNRLHTRITDQLITAFRAALPS